MLAHVTRKTARLLTATRAPGAAVWEAVRTLATEASETPTVAAEAKPKKPRQPKKAKKSLLFGDEAAPAAAAADASAKGEDKAEKAAPVHRKKKTFSFANSQKEPAPELEVFDYPAYWDQDFPEGFDDAMKHEVEKLQIFSDFAALMDGALYWTAVVDSMCVCVCVCV